MPAHQHASCFARFSATRPMAHKRTHTSCFRASEGGGWPGYRRPASLGTQWPPRATFPPAAMPTAPRYPPTLTQTPSPPGGAGGLGAGGRGRGRRALWRCSQLLWLLAGALGGRVAGRRHRAALRPVQAQLLLRVRRLHSRELAQLPRLRAAAGQGGVTGGGGRLRTRELQRDAGGHRQVAH